MRGFFCFFLIQYSHVGMARPERKKRNYLHDFTAPPRAGKGLLTFYLHDSDLTVDVLKELLHQVHSLEERLPILIYSSAVLQSYPLFRCQC